MDSRDSGFANLLISVIGRIGDRLGMLAACYFHTDCSRMMSTFRQTFRRRVADDTSRIVASAGYSSDVNGLFQRDVNAEHF